MLKPGLHFMVMSPRQPLPELVLQPVNAESWAAPLRRHAESGDLHGALRRDHWVQVSPQHPRCGTVILQTDLTEIIRLERLERGKLLDDQARIVRATLDHISQGVGIFDHQARLVGWNARLADLLSLPLLRVRLGMPFASLVAGFGGHLRLGNGFTVQTLQDWVTSTAPRAPLGFEVTATKLRPALRADAGPWFRDDFPTHPRTFRAYVYFEAMNAGIPSQRRPLNCERWKR